MTDVGQKPAPLFGRLLKPFGHPVEGSNYLAHGPTLDFPNPNRVVAARELRGSIDEFADREEARSTRSGEEEERDHAQRPERPGPMKDRSHQKPDTNQHRHTDQGEEEEMRTPTFTRPLFPFRPPGWAAAPGSSVRHRPICSRPREPSRETGDAEVRARACDGCSSHGRRWPVRTSRRRPHGSLRAIVLV